MAQVDCALGDIEANIKKAITLTNEYRGKIDLLIFPELSLTGYSVGKDFHKCAMRLDDPRLKKLIKNTNGITVAVGLIEETPGFKFYNSLAFIKDGAIMHTHRKIYLPNYDIFEEKKYFAPGSNYRTFSHSPFRIAPFICGDAWNPALVHLAATDEANLFLFPACSADYQLGGKLPNQKTWHRLAKFYAMIYGSYVVFVNRTGGERNLNFYGQSTMVNPFGEVVKSAKGNEEGVIVDSINLSQVRRARTILHTVRDENLNLILKELTRVINNKDYL